MRERRAARVLLFDPVGRLLLMKGRLASAPDEPGEWFTVGGGLEPGESVADAARREIAEEAGFVDATMGPVVWRREGRLALQPGETLLIKESYIVARCDGGEPSREGWLPHERALIDDIRWWSLADLRTAQETVHPIGIAELLPDILAGRYPDPPREIPWS
ncbi:NUDIX domain-containing protein [Phenylobacterium sp.]|uniref:NUDIX hydrolase n=1 Tax=Phenylobacterium sp. TaxID=1871053 RepID=UPI002617CA06|nr:NUDIX domain-containing protein [Phenylobacterium sp.]